MDNIISQIQQLGFSAYEAKAYTALLVCQPASAYEIAKQAGIPTSKIYETVSRLVAREVICPLHSPDESRQEYAALAAADFLNRIRETTLAQTDELLPRLTGLSSMTATDPIWPLLSEVSIQRRVLEVINSTRHSLLISLWPQELEWLGNDLTRLEAFGVNIAMVHFGEPAQKIGATYHHPVEKTLYEEKGGRGLTLVADGNIVVIANYQADGSIEGSWSRNKTFVTVAEDYIKHDVYITKVTRFLGPAVKARFGRDYEQLRDVFDADA